MPSTILQLLILEHQDDGVMRVFLQCNLGKLIISNEIDFPDDAPIDSVNELILYYIVADEVFMLLPNVMTPYPGRSKAKLPIDQAVFNYRLK